MKRKGKVSPLMVVATKTPKAVETYPLARFESDKGVYITNANLETHISPFTGDVVSASTGKKVTASLKEDNCIGIQCSCSAINAMDTKQVIALEVSSINCVVCGSKLEFDLEAVKAEYDDMEDMTDMDEESEMDDMEEIEDEAEFDEDEELNDEDEESENYLGGDSISEDVDEESEMDEEDDANEMEEMDEEGMGYEDLTLSEMVPSDEKVSFASIAENRYGAFVGDLMVATLTDTDGKFDHIETEAFAEGFNKVVEREGLKAALESASFKPITVSVKAALANIARKEQARIMASAEDLAAKQIASLKKCLDVAAAGGTVGMFKKEGLTILVDRMAETLANLGVKNPKKTAHKVISGAAAQYNSSLLNVALQLAKKDDSAIQALKEQIESMSPEVVDENEIDEEVIDEESKKSCSTIARLESPIKKTEVASPQPKTFRGLFVA